MSSWPALAIWTSPTTSVPAGGSGKRSLRPGGCPDHVQDGRQSEKLLQPDSQMQAQSAAVQASPEGPVRAAVEGFILQEWVVLTPCVK